MDWICVFCDIYSRFYMLTSVVVNSFDLLQQTCLCVLVVVSSCIFVSPRIGCIEILNRFQSVTYMFSFNRCQAKHRDGTQG